MTVGSPQYHDRVHTPLKVVTVLKKRPVLEPVASLADGNGTKQNTFNRREDVAGAAASWRPEVLQGSWAFIGSTVHHKKTPQGRRHHFVVFTESQAGTQLKEAYLSDFR
jgi:hypothetical protein